MNTQKIFLAFCVLSVIALQNAEACTNYLITKGASADGSTIVTYIADSHVRYGELYYQAAADWKEGDMLTLYDRGSAKPLGQIPQIAHTYQTLGFMNEYQVTIGETTFDGRKELHDTTGIVDYGSLMFVALQRSKTAREAIKVMADLVAEHGYASTGESFSIGDPNEVWIMELIGKGTDLKVDKKTGKTYNADKGAVWVAIRIPDGYISAHANQSRISTFQLSDGKKSITNKQWNLLQNADVEIVYSEDVIDFAKRKGYFKGNDKDFSFCDAFNPVDFQGARFCELRVWSFYNRVSDDMAQYWDYATGKDLSKPRMPLYIKPNRKISVSDVMTFKRDYLQGTELDMTKDAGAGPFGSPVRWRPLTWKYNDTSYFHERATVTQQTGFSFISQMRSWLPNSIGGIHWFAVDDVNTTVYVPFYCSINSVPETYAVGNGDMLDYSENAAFWVFNRVAHFAYLFYNRVYPDIAVVQKELESKFVDYISAIDDGALNLYKKNPELAVNFLTDFSCNMADLTVDRWQKLSDYLLVKYLDGNVKKEKDGEFLRNPYGFPQSPSYPGYPDFYKKQIIDETGEKFKLP